MLRVLKLALSSEEMVRELSQGGSFCGKGQWGMEAHRV